MIPVVIRTRNRHSELASCLNSLVWQTYQDFQVLIFDDGDIPATEDPFVRNAMEALSHIKGVPTQHIRYRPQGEGKTRYWGNACFVMETVYRWYGSHAIFLDDDEFAPPEFIEKLMAVRSVVGLKKFGFTYCPVIDASDVLDRALKVPNWENKLDLPDPDEVEIRHSRFGPTALKPLGNRPWLRTNFMAGGATLMYLNLGGINYLKNNPHPAGDDAQYGKWLTDNGMEGYIRLDLFVVHNVAKAQWSRPR